MPAILLYIRQYCPQHRLNCTAWCRTSTMRRWCACRGDVRDVCTTPHLHMNTFEYASGCLYTTFFYLRGRLPSLHARSLQAVLPLNSKRNTTSFFSTCLVFTRRRPFEAPLFPQQQPLHAEISLKEDGPFPVGRPHVDHDTTTTSPLQSRLIYGEIGPATFRRL